MTKSEMEAIAKRLGELKSAEAMLAAARSDLDKCNALIKRSGSNVGWDAEFVLEKAKTSYDRNVSVKARIPAGVVQQALVYRVMAAERAVVALGGEIVREVKK